MAVRNEAVAQNVKIKNISLGGGGFYGYAEVGALIELETYSEFLDLENIVGVSVGSMVAALYAIGYTPTELRDILFELDFDNLIQDGSYGTPIASRSYAYYRLWSEFGMYRATALEEKIEQLIADKTHIKNCTFSQIKKNLTIITTNLNRQCPRYLNKDLTPNLVISKAVRMSIGYPMIMTPVLFQDEYYGDGGESINYPITYFNDLDKTIGITFAAHNENHNGTLKHVVPINNLSQYIFSLGCTLSRSIYVSQINELHLNRSIVIEILEPISCMQFGLNLEQKKYIYDRGINAVRYQAHKIFGIDKAIWDIYPLFQEFEEFR
jgi:NTE family protein